MGYWNVVMIPSGVEITPILIPVCIKVASNIKQIKASHPLISKGCTGKHFSQGSMDLLTQQIDKENKSFNSDDTILFHTFVLVLHI